MTEDSPRLPKKLTNLAAGVILATGGINDAASVPRQETSPPPTPDTSTTLPDRLIKEVLADHQQALASHEKAIAPLLENPNVSEEIKFLLQNVRIDFYDVNSSQHQGVSMPGESHLLLVATNINADPPITKQVEILEAFHHLDHAINTIDDLGFIANIAAEPLTNEVHDWGDRNYIQVDLNMGILAEALQLDLPDTVDPEAVIPNVARLVTEQHKGQTPIVRDILQSDPNTKVFFGAMDRINQENLASD